MSRRDISKLIDVIALAVNQSTARLKGQHQGVLARLRAKHRKELAELRRLLRAQVKKERDEQAAFRKAVGEAVKDERAARRYQEAAVQRERDEVLRLKREMRKMEDAWRTPPADVLELKEARARIAELEAQLTLANGGVRLRCAACAARVTQKGAEA